MKSDCIVLGAGIVGVCTALHLQKKGLATALIDRREAMAETSFGNAGLIQREGVYPYGFPHDFGALIRYALNNTIDAHYHWQAIPQLAPFLWSYWMHSRPSRHEAIARQYATLIEHCVSEHDALAQESGATNLIRRTGWIKAFRTAKERDVRFAEAERWHAAFGLNHRNLDAAAFRALEPDVTEEVSGALHWTDPTSVRDPHALGMAYLKRFESLGGLFRKGDATTLAERKGGGWSVVAHDGTVFETGQVVLCLGPWSDRVTRRLGYRFPLAVKRGYHMHYRPLGEATLHHPVLDHERGYLLAPMLKGIRLTTGAEFALRDARLTPVQLGRAEPIARQFFPLGERLDAEPWMGARPCTPDMMPIIGPAPRHRGLTFAFGHAHHGLTLGAVTGRMVAEMVTGETPFVDPRPFAPSRFA